MQGPKFYTVLRYFAGLIVLLIFFSVLYGMMLDTELTDVKEDSWLSLFKKEYLANLVISPFWVLVAFLINKANEIENGEWKGQKNQLLGLIKGQQEVSVLDIREIIQNEYNQVSELDKMRADKEKMTNTEVPPDEMKF